LFLGFGFQNDVISAALYFTHGSCGLNQYVNQIKVQGSFKQKLDSFKKNTSACKHTYRDAEVISVGLDQYDTI